MENSLQRMKELVEKLDQAAKAYYQEDREIMSNQEYDSLYDQLEQLEKETGTVLTNSPTVRVGYEAVNELPKEEHPSPMLSLDKTKDREVLRGFIGNHKCLLSWKLDGLTIVLTYENGELVKAVTRGNGIVGEVITNNARVFKNIPLRIPYKGQLVLRGEAIITYSEFERINETIGDADAKYKNPRNLCSGSVRQLNNEITAKRNVRFYAFALVSAQDVDFSNSREQQFIWLKKQGFEVVEYKVVTSESLDEAMDYFSKAIVNNDFPSDGLVVTYDDIAYGESLGSTAKFPRNSFAFKWADEMRETRLVDMEWSPSRTGLINPVAIFEPVELEGTTVSRASVHNISIVKELQLGIGDTIKVYKANMIIPQIAENLTKSGTCQPIEHCPACGGATEVRIENNVKTLYCVNPYCSAKKVKLFSHYVSRDAMNIDGLSEATLMKMIEQGFLSELNDLYNLEQYKEQIIAMDGYGEKSYNNLMQSIEKSRDTQLFRFVYGIGILNVGSSNARLLCRHFGNSLENLRGASVEEMTQIDGIGEVIATSVHDYFENEHNQKLLEKLLPYLHFEEENVSAGGEQEQSLLDKTFVITGTVEHFANRKELKEKIESLGGKVTGSVSKKTDYLINNDNMSSSSKNKKAKELEIPVITEEEFLSMIE